MDNLSLTIKERILLIAGHAKRSKIDFFKDLGLSYANFKGEQKKSGLSSDALLKVLSKYPEINPSWLLLGEGEMLKTAPETTTDSPEIKEAVAEEHSAGPAAHEEIYALLHEQGERIQVLAKRIELLEKKAKEAKKKKKKK